MGIERPESVLHGLDLSFAGNHHDFHVAHGAACRVSAGVDYGTGADLSVLWLDGAGQPHAFASAKTISGASGAVQISEAEMRGVSRLRVVPAGGVTGWASVSVVQDIEE